MYSCKRGCNQEKCFVFGPKLFYSGKVVIIGQSLLHARKVVVFWQKIVVFGKKVIVLGSSGCIRAKQLVFGQKWLYSG